MKFAHINQLCDLVRETSFAIHKYHRNGHLEKIYENALASRLRKLEVNVKQQHPLTVYDEDGTLLGEFFADLLIEDQLIVELKACKAIAEEHIAQLLGYLKSSRIETGLLINFGAPVLSVKKYLMTETTPQQFLCLLVFFVANSISNISCLHSGSPTPA
jgi:GxxExxY protein